MAAVRRKARVDPRAIARQLEQEAWTRSRQRQAARNPETWGVDVKQLEFSANDDDEVEVGARDSKGKVLAAKRLDAFDQLHRFKSRGGRRGLEIEPHRAAQRLIRDNAQRRGIRVGELNVDQLQILVDRSDHQIPVTDGMLRAAERIECALAGVGGRSARLLSGLVDPMFDGEPKAWRDRVEELTAEADRNAQGALVRAACEDLVDAYARHDQRKCDCRRDRQL